MTSTGHVAGFPGDGCRAAGTGVRKRRPGPCGPRRGPRNRCKCGEGGGPGRACGSAHSGALPGRRADPDWGARGSVAGPRSRRRWPADRTRTRGAARAERDRRRSPRLPAPGGHRPARAIATPAVSSRVSPAATPGLQAVLGIRKGTGRGQRGASTVRARRPGGSCSCPGPVRLPPFSFSSYLKKKQLTLFLKSVLDLQKKNKNTQFVYTIYTHCKCIYTLL